MARTSIVTDSTSGLSPEEVRPLGIAIIPMHIEIDGRTYHEGVDLALPEFQQLVGTDSLVPSTSPPTIREFHALFRELARESDEILTITLSSRLSNTIHVARQAAQSFMGRAHITVIDSRLTATPLGWLALAAAEAAAANVDVAEIVHLLRAMMPHMYMAFFAERTECLYERGLVRQTPSISTGAVTKPLLMIEEGEIMALERSRSRGRTVDRLYEFVTEFARIERLVILQGKPLPEAIELATLINEEMPDQPVQTETYPPSIAACVGGEALGVAVYEGLG